MYLDLIDKLEKLPIYTDIETFDIYCEYLLNDNNKAINYSNLMNLYDYINSMDSSVFINNDAKMARYYFIKLYLDARLDDGVTSRKLCLKHVLSNVDKRYSNIIIREIIESFERDKLSKKDIQFINGMIFAHLNTIFMQRYKIGFIKMVEDLDTNNFINNVEESISFLQTVLSDLTASQRRAKQDNRFNLTDELLYHAVLKEACERLLSESQFLITGCHGLNIMLNGGFELSRVYNFIGATGGFKSGLLLNILKWLKLYNKSKKPKDPTKRKTVLFVSQENNLWETIQRVFNIFATIDSIKNYTYKEIVELLKEGGFKVVDDENDVDIEFRYFGNEDIGVPDLKGMVEELENDGKEVIAIIQDYIERLRPPKRNAERRIQLFDISNQLHDLAVDLEIPIITASQFNKEGVAIIEEMTSQNKADIAKSIGQKNISESFGMLKNIDVNIAIVIEYSVEEKKYYLSFRKLKFRGADDTKIDFFLHPFAGTDSKIMLIDDLKLPKPLTRLTLSTSMPTEYIENVTNINKGIRKRKKIGEPLEINESDDMEALKGFETRIDMIKKDIYKKNDKGLIKLVRKIS